MARIKYSSLVSDMSGKLNGGIAQKGVSGSVLINKPTRISKMGVNAVAARNRLANVQQIWKTLSKSQKAEWTQWAEYAQFKSTGFGSAVISGQSVYIKINSQRLQQGLSVLVTPVDNTKVVAPVTVTFNYNSGLLFANFSRMISSTNDLVQLFVSGPVSPGVTAINGRLKCLKLGTFSGTTKSISSAYVDIFGVQPPAGGSILVNFRVIRLQNGWASPWQKMQITLPKILLLDAIPNSTNLAFGVYKLKASYNGQCVRLIRQSDNVQSDFGFVDNVIDAAAINTWVGASQAYIVKWYNQASVGNDLVRVSAGNYLKWNSAGYFTANYTGSGYTLPDWQKLSTDLFSVTYHGMTVSNNRLCYLYGSGGSSGVDESFMEVQNTPYKISFFDGDNTYNDNVVSAGQMFIENVAVGYNGYKFYQNKTMRRSDSVTRSDADFTNVFVDGNSLSVPQVGAVKSVIYWDTELSQTQVNTIVDTLL